MSFRLIKGMISTKLGLNQRLAPRGPLGLGLGRLVTLDEAPFILAQGAVDCSYPGEQCQVIGHGRLDAGGVKGHRYYLAGQGGALVGLLQIVPDTECRYFRPFDEVYPGSAEEWAFWLDPTDGYIGYPNFDAKGTLYQRVWNPSPQRIAPLWFEETVEQGDGGQSRAEHTAMLYAREGVGAGGRVWSYLLVSAIRAADGNAWIDLMLGMDVLPSGVNVI